MKLKKINSAGYVHYLAPLVVVVMVAGIGGYIALKGTHAATTCYDTPNINPGATGQCVKDIQSLLNYDLYALNTKDYLTVDGGFGPLTKAAVEQEQKNSGIPQNGGVGQKTWNYICEAGFGPAPSWYDNAAENAGCPGY
jgi:peptidoglycan hydrolase-like protein with peptidoglycan-binding domain